jgi:hypothetical protein
LEYQLTQGIETTLEKTQSQINDQIKKNIENERCVEEWSFFKTKFGEYRNESFIEFSFMDF